MDNVSKIGWSLLFVAFTLPLGLRTARTQQSEKAPLDPAAWGEDHVGKRLPDYVTGDECLFCHRTVVGAGWPTNRHGTTVRFGEADEFPLTNFGRSAELKKHAGEAAYVMGRDRQGRLLRRGKAYGQLAISSVSATPGGEGTEPGILHGENPYWDETKFTQSCMGCHTTAVQTDPPAFGAVSLDCYACHGDVTLDHTADTKLMLLSEERDDSAHVVASICAQCHLRGGKSRSTGKPYPNQFVPGDNLFKDFEVDFSDEYLASLNPGDRHIDEATRDIVIGGERRTTCLTCHEIHRQTSEIHNGVRKADVCLTCHYPTGSKKEVIPYESHSALCEY